MQVNISPNKEKSEVALKITADPDELSPYLKEAAKKLSKEKSIKGFRPGKAPVNVVEDVIGTERLYNEALDKAVPRFFVEAVLDNNIEAVAQPSVSIESLDKEKGLTFTATVTVLPEVSLGDFQSIEVERRTVAIRDKDIEKELQHVAKMRSQYLDVARPAKPGDTVTVDFKISMQGVVMEGGESKEHPVHLGEGHFVEDFEKKLEGIAAGDEREFEISFPEDYAKKDLRGKTAQAWVKAHAVQKRVAPEINDDFAKQLGKFSSLHELKKSLKENMQHEREHREEERMHAEMTEKLAEAATFAQIPDALIEKEIDRRMAELREMLHVQKKTLDDYLAANKKKVEDVRGEMRESAEKSVKIGLALRKFAEQESIQVSEEDVAKKVDEYLQRFKSPEEAQQSVDVEELKEQLAYMLRNQQAMKKLEEKITVKQQAAKSKGQNPKVNSNPKSE